MPRFETDKSKHLKFSDRVLFCTIVEKTSKF